MGLWIARSGDLFTVHTKKPKWEDVACSVPDCLLCSGFSDPIFDICAEDGVKVIPGLRKMKNKSVTKLTVKIGGK